MGWKDLIIEKNFTPRDSGSLDIYLSDVSRKAKLITVEREVILTQKIKKGDHNAVNELATANLRFVVSVAKTYKNRGLDISDLIQEGNIGMVRSIEKFDETRGFKFISHSVWWIRQSMIQALAETTKNVRIPLNKNYLFNKINKFIEKFEDINERRPTDDEINELLGISFDHIRDFNLFCKKQLSLDKPFFEEKEGTFLDILNDESSVSPDKELLVESFYYELEFCLSSLSSRDRYIVEKFYGLGCESMLASKIAIELNTTDQTVRNVLKRSVKKFRKPEYIERLRSFL